MPRLAILKKIGTQDQNSAWLSLMLYCIGNTLKNVQKQVRLFWWGYINNDNESEAENEK